MDDVAEVPKVFANRLILQLVEHSFGGGLEPTKKDYLAMRTAFRSLGGKWSEISLGSPAHLDILKQVVTTWGSQPHAKAQIEEIV